MLLKPRSSLLFDTPRSNDQMLKSSIIVILSLVAVASSVSAWTPPNPSRATLQYQSRSEQIFDIARLGDGEHDRGEDGVLPRTQALIVLSAITLPIAITPEIASAATAFTSTSLPSALAAYVPYHQAQYVSR